MKPRVILDKPKAGQANVPRATDVLLHLVDAGTGLSQASVVLKIDSVTAWTGDAQQPGFAVTKTVVGSAVYYNINPTASFFASTPVLLEVYAEDLGGPPDVLDEAFTFHTGAWV